MYYVGISGWSYEPWRGVFYPKGLKAKEELPYAAKAFTSIEVNGTFYGLKKPKDFHSWREQIPVGFPLTIKATRYITHIRRLKNIRTPVANFLASGPLALGPSLGPFLWQLPPNLVYEAEVMRDFFALLPQNGKAAKDLFKDCDSKVEGRSFTEIADETRLRHAVEIRNLSFARADFLALASDHNIALVQTDSSGIYPIVAEPTADFCYVRMHGLSSQQQEQGYQLEELKLWAKKIAAWSEGGDAFIYFDNEGKITAPGNAAEFLSLLSPQGVKIAW